MQHVGADTDDRRMHVGFGLRPIGSAAARVSLLLLASAVTSFGADYYISNSGNDRNSGLTMSQAWKSFSPVNGASFRAGDRLLLEGGQTFHGRLAFGSDDAGIPSNPIVLSSYGRGRATILAGSGDGVVVYNTAGFHVSGLNVVGSGSTVNTGSGINFYADLPGDVKLEYVSINDVEVSGFGKYGISVGAYNGKTGFRHVRITHSSAHDNAEAGINVWGYPSATATTYAHENVYIAYCRTYNNTGKATTPLPSGSGITVSDVNTAVIERSVAHGNGALNTSRSGPVGIWAYDATNVVIQFNEAYGNRTGTGGDGGGFDLDGGTTNSVMQYNYSHDNDGAGFLICRYQNSRATFGNTVRYNVSQNDGRKNSYAGIQFYDGGGGIKDINVHNNTVFQSPSVRGRPRALWFYSGITNARIWNNIFVTTGGLPLADIVSGQTGLLVQGNVYWSSGAPFLTVSSGRSYTSLSAWRAGAGIETVAGRPTGFDVDPLLGNPGGGRTIGNANLLSSLDAYRLRPGSPLVNTGLDLAGLYRVGAGSQDYYGGKLTQDGLPDIGAHELAVLAYPNQSPLARAGLDQVVGLPMSARLHGAAVSASPTGTPFAVRWSQVSGPATVQFENALTEDTMIQLPAAGRYVFQFQVSDGANTAADTVAVTASASPVAPALTGVALVSLPEVLADGSSSNRLKVLLHGPVPPAGAQLTLSSSNPGVASVPALVPVTAGALNAAGIVTTTGLVANPMSATISVTYGDDTKTADLLVSPTSVSGITLPAVVLNSGTSTSSATVSLMGPAPQAGAAVQLSSSNPAVIAVPSSVMVPEGATLSAPFKVTSATVASEATATVTATYRGLSKSVVITVRPASLAGLSVPARTTGGTVVSTNRVSLTGRASTGGAVVSLMSSHPAVVAVPTTVTIPAGQTASPYFTVTTSPVTAPVAVTITATYAGMSKSVVTTVSPAAP